MVELDKEQEEAVNCGSSCLVVAGPGSGKTRVLTERARKLWNAGKSIICLTFTRAAASEMQKRVNGLPACTIHSYCCGYVGWDERWEYPGLLKRYLDENDKTQYQNVLVDEAQDLNELELDVVMALVEKEKGNIFMVGDPLQSIYGFQGALGQLAFDWMRDGWSSKEVFLKNNYRSNKEIVERLNGWFDRGLVSLGPKDLEYSTVLTRTNEDLLFISKFLEAQEVPHTVRFSKNLLKEEEEKLGGGPLKVMTIHSSKGQEFNNVYLFGWRPQELGEEERVYYVAMSRASKEFHNVFDEYQLVDLLPKNLRESRETFTGTCLPKISPSNYAVKGLIWE